MSDSDDELPAPPKRLRDESTIITGLGPSTSSQDSVASERQVRGWLCVYELNIASKIWQRYIEESRQIMEEQDRAYYESLKADQEKV